MRGKRNIENNSSQAIHSAYTEKKAVQAAYHVCRFAGGTIDFQRLLKILYLADRISLEQRGRPITFDLLCNMDQGPLPSTIYDRFKPLIHRNSSIPQHPEWSRAFSKQGVFNLRACEDPGVDCLSRNNLRILEEAYLFAQQYRIKDDLEKYLHSLPEYVDPTGSSLPISYRTILENFGYSKDEIDNRLSELAFDAQLQKLSLV